MLVGLSFLYVKFSFLTTFSCLSEGPSASRKKVLSAGSEELEKLVPPVCVPLPSGSCYFLLDDFNHHHQHAVVPGSRGLRYSSTHRVSRTEGHTFSSVRARLTSSLAKPLPLTARAIHAEQVLQSEVEFEWIRQFYVQGSRHRSTHEWWHQPMQELVSLWLLLEERTQRSMQALRDAVESLRRKTNPQHVRIADLDASLQKRERRALEKRLSRAAKVEPASFAAMTDALRDRANKRQGWWQREQDILAMQVSAELQPLPLPLEAKAKAELLSHKELLLVAEEIDLAAKAYHAAAQAHTNTSISILI